MVIDNGGTGSGLDVFMHFHTWAKCISIVMLSLQWHGLTLGKLVLHLSFYGRLAGAEPLLLC